MLPAEQKRRLESLEQQVETLQWLPPAGCPCIVVQVIEETTVPTDPNKYVACSVVDVSGDEEEGGDADFDVISDSTIYVAVLGATMPEAGDYMVAHAVGGRWVTNG